MKTYDFVSNWKVEAPLELVWTILKKAEDWPLWWKALKSVDVLQSGAASGVGERTRSVWRTALPYTLQFDFELTEVNHLERIAGKASGELEGFGCWTFSTDGSYTHLRYDWQVKTTKAWMNALAPLLKPAFQWNHDVVMQWGEDGLNAECKRQIKMAELENRIG